MSEAVLKAKQVTLYWSLHLYMMKLKMLEMNQKYFIWKDKNNFGWISLKYKPWGRENLSSSKGVSDIYEEMKLFKDKSMKDNVSFPKSLSLTKTLVKIASA